MMADPAQSLWQREHPLMVSLAVYLCLHEMARARLMEFAWQLERVR
jgi:hypothetical protein